MMLYRSLKRCCFINVVTEGGKTFRGSKNVDYKELTADEKELRSGFEAGKVQRLIMVPLQGNTILAKMYKQTKNEDYLTAAKRC
jgi:hypothetical protein